MRPALAAIGRKFGATVQVVEVPPGPPVQAPIVAEIYGLVYAGSSGVAGEVRDVFDATPDIVDVDDSIEAPRRALVVAVDRSKAALLGVCQQQITRPWRPVCGATDVTYPARARAISDADPPGTAGRR